MNRNTLHPHYTIWYTNLKLTQIKDMTLAFEIHLLYTHSKLTHTVCLCLYLFMYLHTLYTEPHGFSILAVNAAVK